MIEIYTHIIKIITDSTQQWTKRSAAVIVILFTLWLLNDTFDFVNSFRRNNKLQQLETIGKLIKDSTLTKEQTNILIAERQRIFVHRTIIDKVYYFFDSLPNPISLIKQSTTQKPDTATVTSKKSLINDDSVPIPTKNYWLTFVSSNALILLIILFAPFSSSFKREKITWVNLVAMVVIFGLIFLICAFITYLFNFIPIIDGDPWKNYFVNFFIQFGVWILISYLFSKVKTKK